MMALMEKWLGRNQCVIFHRRSWSWKRPTTEVCPDHLLRLKSVASKRLEMITWIAEKRSRLKILDRLGGLVVSGRQYITFFSCNTLENFCSEIVK
ncbi:hypothetical protein Y032_0001g300 [Ancylostoma ceylanicum]|uniref:Uncharacterized protein n=1 Tax=Ancylostoma ceylanicum TaxID=53326 RepID=A0A016W2X4_9BILA|nr:hypothetical protein Y032_0001g300 [Ancylostoma ceylanicum]